jgi:periplasmic divalent cation tolerance protein
VDSDQFLIALTTLPAEHDAEQFASHLVDERLAACVNILPPVRSVYRWKDTMERASETQLIIKTTRDQIERLEARIREMHPYEVPEFLVISVAHGGSAYLSWVRDSTVKP